MCQTLQNKGQKWELPLTCDEVDLGRSGDNTLLGPRLITRIGLGIQHRGIGAGYGLAKLRVELDDLLMLSASDVSGIGVVAGTGNIAELAAKGIAGTTCRWLLRHLHRGFLLFVFLTLQVLAISLWSSAADLADVAVMQLLWLGRLLGSHGLHAAASTSTATARAEALASVALPTSGLRVSRIAVCALLSYVHCRGAVQRCVVAGVRCTRRF